MAAGPPHDRASESRPLQAAEGPRRSLPKPGNRDAASRYPATACHWAAPMVDARAVAKAPAKI